MRRTLLTTAAAPTSPSLKPCSPPLTIRLFYIEYDTARAGNFEPLRFLPKNNHVLLGLATTKSPEMEDLGQLVLRVHETADVIAKGQGEGRTREQVLKENLAVSPQRGFSSAMVGGGNRVTEDVMWKKLDLVGIWRTLFGRTECLEL